jgi:hypothetical protein
VPKGLTQAVLNSSDINPFCHYGLPFRPGRPPIHKF